MDQVHLLLIIKLIFCSILFEVYNEETCPLSRVLKRVRKKKALEICIKGAIDMKLKEKCQVQTQQRDGTANPDQVCPMLLWFSWCFQGVTREDDHEVDASVLKSSF